jgi:predicted DNA-binding protein
MKAISFRLDDEDYNKIKAVAIIQNRTIANYCRNVVLIVANE